LLVTGGAGFIGSNLVRHVLGRDPDVTLTNLDLLTYSGNRASLEEVERRHGDAGDGRHRFVHADIRDASTVTRLLAGDAGRPPIDTVIHCAAESHVDRSILGPLGFVDTNVSGTGVLIEGCRQSLASTPREFRFVHVSTDEVYGSLDPGAPAFTESHPLAPSSPYSASKAGSDLLVWSYFKTFDLPFVITRCSNNYGPYQFPEKLIPLMITRALDDAPLPVYGDGRNVRDWIYVEDHCDALWTVACRGEPGRCYNIGGRSEVTNIELVRRILAGLGKPESLIRYVDDRLGHDRRYAIDSRLIEAELGWSPDVALDTGLETTLSWYLEHRDWWRPLLPESGRVARSLYRAEP
jgi:dTDP-glucose 4,6-dehydratase